MRVIFVASVLETNSVFFGKDKLETLEEIHDPMTGLAEFASFWSGIDNKERCPPVFDFDYKRAKYAFWDRSEFLETLDAIGTGEVYIQSNSSFNLRMMFTKPEDETAFATRIMIPRKHELEGFTTEMIDGPIRFWLLKNDLRERIDFTIEKTLDGADDMSTLIIRDEDVAMLVKVQFRHTHPWQHDSVGFAAPRPPIMIK